MSTNGNITWTGISTPNSFNNLNVSNVLSVNKINNFPHTVTVVGYTPVEFSTGISATDYFLMKAPGLNQPDRTVPLDPNKINAITAPPKGNILGAQMETTDLTGALTSVDLGHSTYADPGNDDIFTGSTVSDISEGVIAWGNGGATIVSEVPTVGESTGGTNSYIKIRPDGNVTAGGVKVQLHYLIVDKN